MRSTRRRSLSRWASALGLLSALALAVQARAHAPRGGVVVSNDGAYRVTFELDPAAIEVRELFAVSVHVERLDGRRVPLSLAVDARMPEHGHGMNREPLILGGEPGSFSVTNLLFHMPGHWELYFDVTEGAVCERAQIAVELE